jgi:hypothetical protein
METLTRIELRDRLATECRARKWRVPSQKRLKKLRDTEQLPKAIPHYEKGKRGRSWLYDASTVEAYVLAEERRRASGKRVRSWKLVEQREKTQVIRDWLERLDDPIPRETIASELEAFAGLFHRIAAAVFDYVEHPVGPLDDDRLEGAHTAIESMLSGSTLTGETRAAAEALLRILIFRDEEGNAEDFDLAELLAPIRQKAGPFAIIGNGMAGICKIVREIPLNALLTHPRALLEQVSDGELRQSARMTLPLFAAIERIAKVAPVILAVVEKARSHEKLRNYARIEWCKPIADGSAAVARFMQSEFTPSLLCASALLNVWLIRRDADALLGTSILTTQMADFAQIVEGSKFAKPKAPVALQS